MKKVFLVILAFMVISTFLSVQAIAQTTVKMGVKAGLNFSNIYGDDTDLAGRKTGFALGGFANFDINEKFSFQPEIFITMKGYEVDFGSLGVSKIKINYLEIPVLLNVVLDRGETIGFEIFSGPAIAFKLSGKVEFDGEETDIENMKSFDFGLVSGARLNMGQFFIEPRFTIGLADIFDNPNSDDKVSNTVLSILGGISF